MEPVLQIDALSNFHPTFIVGVNIELHLAMHERGSSDSLKIIWTMGLKPVIIFNMVFLPITIPSTLI
jgi:hypothetical protein